MGEYELWVNFDGFTTNVTEERRRGGGEEDKLGF